MQHRRTTVDVSDVNTAPDFAASAFAPPRSDAGAVFVPPPMTAASAGDRLLAQVGDAFGYSLAGLLGAAFGVGATALHNGLADFSATVASPGLVAGVWIGLTAMLTVQVYLLSTRGQTIGKKMVGIRIVRTNGQPAGFVRAWLLRSALVRSLELLGGPLVFAALAFWIVNIGCLWSNHRRMLHDRIAGTRVIDV